MKIPLHKFIGHTDEVKCITFSPNGRLLATGSDDKTIRIWSVKTGEQLKILEEHIRGVDSVTFSHDGQFLKVNVLNKEFFYNIQTRETLTYSELPDGLKFDYKQDYQHNVRVYPLAENIILEINIDDDDISIDPVTSESFLPDNIKLFLVNVYKALIDSNINANDLWIPYSPNAYGPLDNATQEQKKNFRENLSKLINRVINQL